MNIVWFFVIFFGFTFVISGEGVDANRYRDWFLLMGRHNISFSTFVSFLYSAGTRYVDVVQPLISFLLSKVTNDPRILFAVFGSILGYFYSRNVWYLLDHAGPRIVRHNLPLIITFGLLIGFWQLNGFRFWTAAHVYLFGVLPYLIEGDKKKLWIASLSVFFHFTFLLPLAVLSMYMLLGNRVHVYFYFFIISLFIYEIDFQVINNLVSYFPSILQDRSLSYLSHDYAVERSEAIINKSWHARYYLDALKLALLIMTAFVYFNIKKLKYRNNWLIAFFSFSLLFLGVFNILGNIPSVGRFITLGNMFLVSFFFIYFQHDTNTRNNKLIMLVTSPLLLMFCIVSLRTGLDFFGIYTLFGNPVIALFGPGEYSIMDTVKVFFK